MLAVPQPVTTAFPTTVAIIGREWRYPGVHGAEIVTGPADVDYAVPELAPGSYTFTCTIHPNMTGTLTVVP